MKDGATIQDGQEIREACFGHAEDLVYTFQLQIIKKGLPQHSAVRGLARRLE